MLNNRIWFRPVGQIVDGSFKLRTRFNHDTIKSSVDRSVNEADSIDSFVNSTSSRRLGVERI